MPRKRPLKIPPAPAGYIPWEVTKLCGGGVILYSKASATANGAASEAPCTAAEQEFYAVDDDGELDLDLACSSRKTPVRTRMRRQVHAATLSTAQAHCCLAPHRLTVASHCTGSVIPHCYTAYAAMTESDRMPTAAAPLCTHPSYRPTLFWQFRIGYSTGPSHHRRRTRQRELC